MIISKFLVICSVLLPPMMASAAVTNFRDIDVSYSLGDISGTPSIFPLEDHPGSYAHEQGSYATNIGQTDMVGVNVHTNSLGARIGVDDSWQLTINEGELVDFKITADVNDLWTFNTGPFGKQTRGLFSVTFDNINLPTAIRTTSANITNEFGDRFFTEGYLWNDIPAGIYNFSLNGSIIWNYSVSTAVSAVPVPASFWLLGTGLIALISFAKRKSTI